jgi:hypothetical protein
MGVLNQRNFHSKMEGETQNLQIRTDIFAAVVVVTLLSAFGAEMGFSLSPDSSSTTTAAITILQTTTMSSTQQSTRLYEMTFSEAGYCSPPAYYAPWAVALNNKTTIAEPPSATLPLEVNGGAYSPYNKNFSVITFSVPNGTYDYAIYPQPMFQFQSGVVTVNGSDVLVRVHGISIPCAARVDTWTLVGAPTPCLFIQPNCVMANYTSNVNFTINGILFFVFYDPQGQAIAILDGGLTLAGGASEKGIAIYSGTPQETVIPQIPLGVCNVSVFAISTNNEVISTEQYFVMNYT